MEGLAAAMVTVAEASARQRRLAQNRRARRPANYQEILSKTEQIILEAVETGFPGFRGGWVSSIALAGLLTATHGARALPLNKRRDVLRSLGYDWHLALSGGRTSTVVIPDGGRPRLFIKADHPAAGLKTQSEVIEAYQAAQIL